MKRGRKQNAALTQRIGYRIFKERELRGLTAQVLADRAGLHRNTVVRAEQGRAISVPSLVAMAGAMGMGLDALLSNAQYVVHCENEYAVGRGKAVSVIHGTDLLFEESDLGAGKTGGLADT